MKTAICGLWVVTIALGVVSFLGCSVGPKVNKTMAEEPRKSPFAPTQVFQCTSTGNLVSFKIVRKEKDLCIDKVWAYTNTICDGKGTEVAAKRKLHPERLFTGPLEGNDVCPETLTVEKASPCYYFEINSGGTPYPYCYHDGKYIDPEYCINHTGVCQSH